MRQTIWTYASRIALAAGVAGTALPAFAQSQAGTTAAAPAPTPPVQAVDQIVVTARKRQETDLSVPVSLTAMSSVQIERQAIVNMFDVAQNMPELSVNNNTSDPLRSDFTPWAAPNSSAGRGDPQHAAALRAVKTKDTQRFFWSRAIPLDCGFRWLPPLDFPGTTEHQL